MEDMYRNMHARQGACSSKLPNREVSYSLLGDAQHNEACNIGCYSFRSTKWYSFLFSAANYKYLRRDISSGNCLKTTNLKLKPFKTATPPKTETGVKYSKA